MDEQELFQQQRDRAAALTKTDLTTFILKDSNYCPKCNESNISTTWDNTGYACQMCRECKWQWCDMSIKHEWRQVEEAEEAKKR